MISLHLKVALSNMPVLLS